METSSHERLTKLIYKFLKVVWGLQIIILMLTVAYSVLGLPSTTFFSGDYTLAIKEVPLRSDQPGLLAFNDGSEQPFIITSALARIQFMDPVEGPLRLVALREIIFQVAGLYIVFLVIRLCKSLLEKQPFTFQNANRIRNIAFVSIAVSLINTCFIFLLGTFLNGKISAGSLKANINTHLDYTVLLVGLLLLVIAEIYRIGVRIQEEQRLFI